MKKEQDVVFVVTYADCIEVPLNNRQTRVFSTRDGAEKFSKALLTEAMDFECEPVLTGNEDLNEWATELTDGNFEEFSCSIDECVVEQ